MRKLTNTNSHLPNLKPQDVEDTVLMQTLYRACSTKRPSGSIEEAKFAAWMAVTFNASMIDEAGNIHFDRRKNGERTLWTAHTDTVHYTAGPNRIKVDGKFWKANQDVLGADDGAGCALIAHMLERGVPGYFCLFRSEECGGQGSKWLAENMPELLEEFDRAIAFDRAGYYDVITHQAGTRCCSDEFALALADQLTDQGLMFVHASEGVYTDTAEFTELIAECTNLSVGYFHQHSNEEIQDVEFLKELADVLCVVDWESLPVKRSCNVPDIGWYKYGINSCKGLSEALHNDDLGLSKALTKAILGDSYDDLGKLLSMISGYLVTVPLKSEATDSLLDAALTSLADDAEPYLVASDLCDIFNWSK